MLTAPHCRSSVQGARLRMAVTPHLLLLPSDLSPFAKVRPKCLGQGLGYLTDTSRSAIVVAAGHLP
jgi:hypothetical protein